MTANRGVGVPVTGTSPNFIGTTATEHRLQLAGQYAENAPGVPRSGVLAQGDPVLVKGRSDWSYDIGPAQLVISRSTSEGVYTPTLTGTTNIATSAAPGSGSRWDLIYVLQRDPGKSDADNVATVGVVQGTSGSSPSKPTASLPAGAYVLAEAQVFSGSTGTSGSPNSISQVWRYTAARGGIITIRSAAELAEITTPHPGMTVCRLDLPGAPTATYLAGWNLEPLGELGTFTFTGSAATSTVANNPYQFNVDLQANRRIKVTATVRGKSNTAGAVIAYWVRYGGSPGGTDGSLIGDQHNKAFVQTTDAESATFGGVFTNTAAGSIRISLVALVTVTSATVSFANTGTIVITVEDCGPA
ncbi:hypothetical protein [Pseudarthrobacter sp. ATCC 49987]|uniref:hypothetical protein n=1 Tax=Pseudarthrobacter sp. ATCC 49987 TaxID=2698204 RepID=UPI00136908B5|nr:hypothetical protein [Pseudarthrobacter sp. ATCC 49987]